MTKILITGASGFIGSHIVENLISGDFQIMALKRTTTDCWRCSSFNDQIVWIDIDSEGAWKNYIVNFKPTIIIHAAWIGVEAGERDDLSMQVKNINFLVELLKIAKGLRLDKFIVLGSQAEYGVLNGKVSEEEIVSPVTAYASVKIASMHICKTFCEQNNIAWIWIRVFSVFGERESENWLIPSIIKKMKTAMEVDLTAGNQKYAYLYVQDFAGIIKKICMQVFPSGVYNISADKTISLKQLISAIKNKLNSSSSLNWGILPYRVNQSMHIEGDITKLISQIGPCQFTDLSVALDKTIKYYISNSNSKSN